MKPYFIAVFFITQTLAFTQSSSLENVLRFDEYLGLVKQFHPIVKQANLVIDESQAKLLKSRGAFDPKIEVDYDRKKFKGTEYFDRLNGTFKVPTWFGVELKGVFEQNSGEFLNPEAFVPDNGLYSAGISVPIGRDLLINDRMAALKQAKLYREQAQADRDIYVNTILFEAALVYFEWLMAYNEYKVFENFLTNAQFRFKGIQRGQQVGQNADIDVVEARIALNSRKLSLEQASVMLNNAKLNVSNFLWLQNNIPVELQPNIIPDINSEDVIDNTLDINALQTNEMAIENHPKLRSLNYKIERLDISRKLSVNNLLPKFNVEYNFLTENPDVANTFNTGEYKGGVNIALPLFLRKERGDLRLAKIKLQDTEFERDATRLSIRNKIEALQMELSSYVNQNTITAQMISDYESMLEAEERKFQLGESSLFLVNSRESKLIDSRLKAISIQNKFFKTKAKLFNSLAVNPTLN